MSLWSTTLSRLGIGSRNGATAKGLESLPLPNRASQGQYADWRNVLASFMAQVQPISPTEARDGRDNSVVAIALNWITTSWEVAIPQVGRMDSTGVFLPLPKHPLLDLLESPSPDQLGSPSKGMDGATLRSALISEMVRKGNAYAHIITSRAGVPVGLEYLPTRYTKPVPSPETGRLSHYEYSPNGARFILQPSEVLHLRTGVNEDFPLEGVSLLAAQYREIVTDNSYSDFAAGLSKNGSIPPLMFTPRQTPDGMMAMTSEEAKQISDALNEKMRQEPGRPRVLPGSLEMHKMGLSPNEMAITDVRAMPETRIPAALGLPSVLLQLYTGIQKSTYNNLSEAIKQGWRGCMIPLMAIIAKAINRQLLPLFPNSAGLVFRFDTSGVPELIDDGLDNRKADREDVASGILTVDEARARQGLEALPKPPPVATVPMTATTDTVPSPSAKAWQARTVKVSSATDGDTSDLYAAADKYRRALAGDEADALNALGKEWERTRRALTRRTRSLLDYIAEQEAAGVEPDEWRADAASRLSKLTEQIDTELASLSDRSAAVVEDAQRAAIGTASAHVTGLATAAAGTPPEGVSLSFSTLPSESFEALVGFASDGSPLSQLLATFGAESAALIRSSLLEGIAAGDNPRQVAARLAMATNVSRARLENICRTEMLRANREATRRTYVANNDVVSGYQRLSAADSRTCIACWALHGTKQELGEVMPSHCQCRCVAVPVVKSWAEITGDPTLPDSREDMVSGPDLFGMLPEASQAEILGPARFDLYRAGVSLGDMVETPTNAQWGPETRIKPLDEVTV